MCFSTRVAVFESRTKAMAMCNVIATSVVIWTRFLKLIEDAEVCLSQQELHFLNHVQRQWLCAMSLQPPL